MGPWNYNEFSSGITTRFERWYWVFVFGTYKKPGTDVKFKKERESLKINPIERKSKSFGNSKKSVISTEGRQTLT